MVLAIVAIVAVVAGAAYLIYKNWEPIKGFFSNLWSGVKDAFSSAWNGIKGVVGTGIEFIKGVIKSIDTVFADNPILNLLIPIIGIPRIIIANWSSIKGFFVSLWGGIKSSAESMWSSISSGASNAWNAIVGFFSPIGDWFAAKWEYVKLLTGAVWSGIK